MAAPEFEVKVPGDDLESHVEAEWREGPDVVHLKRFQHRYECFWYTDATSPEFVDSVEQLSNLSQHVSDITKEDEPEVTLTRTVPPRDKVQTGNETQTSRAISALQKEVEQGMFEYLEFEIDTSSVYWKEETPGRADYPDYSNIINISAPHAGSPYVWRFLLQLAPDRMGTEKRKELVMSVVKYIHNDNIGETQDGTEDFN